MVQANREGQEGVQGICTDGRVAHSTSVDSSIEVAELRDANVGVRLGERKSMTEFIGYDPKTPLGRLNIALKPDGVRMHYRENPSKQKGIALGCSINGVDIFDFWIVLSDEAFTDSAASIPLVKQRIAEVTAAGFLESAMEKRLLEIEESCRQLMLEQQANTREYYQRAIETACKYREPR